jgi:hypothetical protein
MKIKEIGLKNPSQNAYANALGIATSTFKGWLKDWKEGKMPEPEK